MTTNNYNRCVGRPLDWVDAQILGENGEGLPPNVVGRLGVKAPSVTTGYWNNSLLTFRSRLSGYFLTGDLAYKDLWMNRFHQFLVARFKNFCQFFTGAHTSELDMDINIGP